jgi:hypothetical protein
VKKHSTDLVSLVFGLSFAALVGWWAIARATDARMDARWLVVTALAVIGVVILVSTLTRRTRHAEEPTPVDDSTTVDDSTAVDDSPAEATDDRPARMADDSPTELIGDQAAREETYDGPAPGPRP